MFQSFAILCGVSVLCLFQNKLYLQLDDFETDNMNYVVCRDFNINTPLNNVEVSKYIAALNSIGCN